MKGSLDLFSATCKDLGHIISTKKTGVMYQPAPAVPYIEPTLTMGGEMLAVTDKFTSLGSTLSRAVTINKEVNYRVAHASAAFSRLQASV